MPEINSTDIILTGPRPIIILSEKRPQLLPNITPIGLLTLILDFIGADTRQPHPRLAEHIAKRINIPAKSKANAPRGLHSIEFPSEYIFVGTGRLYIANDLRLLAVTKGNRFG